MKVMVFGKMIFVVATASALIGSFLQTVVADENPSKDSTANRAEALTAVFAGGCFWCVESDFEHLPGVLEVVSGYVGGRTKKPTYQNYKTGGHREAVMITYDPKKVTYAGLVEFLIKHIDPTDRTGSFIDRGTNYSSAIYYANADEKKDAKRVIDAINGWKVFRESFSIDIVQLKPFWPAEKHHQDYAKNSPDKYSDYRATCGRDPFIAKVWGQRANRLELPGSLPSDSTASSNDKADEKKIKQP